MTPVYAQRVDALGGSRVLQVVGFSGLCLFQLAFVFTDGLQGTTFALVCIFLRLFQVWVWTSKTMCILSTCFFLSREDFLRCAL